MNIYRNGGTKQLNIQLYWYKLNIMEKNIPKIGDKIYVPSSFYVYRGEDDFTGGLATITKIEYSDHLPADHMNYIMVGIDSRPTTMYNYRVLMRDQVELEKEYKDSIAHPSPDMSPEFNQPDADWK